MGPWVAPVNVSRARASEEAMRRWALLSLPGLLVIAGLSTARAAEVELRVEDEAGQPMPARVHLRDAHNQPYPGFADSALMSHSSLGGFFYTPGTVIMELPAGPTRILVGRGFEWKPVEIRPDIAGDTCIVMRMEKPCDMRSRGWFSGDAHMHTQPDHRGDPASGPAGSGAAWSGQPDGGGGGPYREDYAVSPEGLLRIALAEDLAQAWALDGSHEFTGAPHPLSTPEVGLFFCTEYINQAYGHAALLGQRSWHGSWCCPPPHPAYPMLYHIWSDWTPGSGEGLSLCHPNTGAGFFDDEGWPGCGLGRELPVLAALGRLEALEIVSYSNDPDVYLEDWYRLLRCGLSIPPVAGTDARLNTYTARPAGGYRVYVREEPGGQHEPSAWMEGLKAGRCFVTNYPLIPRFTVDGVEMGGSLSLPAPGQVQVDLRIECVLPLSSAQILCDGTPVLHWELPSGPTGTVFETVASVPVDHSCWLALRVDGTTELRHATASQLFAHTAPVHIAVAGAPWRSTPDAGFYLDWLDSLWMFVQIRDHWEEPSQPREVRARIDEAAAVFATAFTEPPPPCTLLAPAWGDTVLQSEILEFDWTDVVDPEFGDRVVYYLELAADDSAFVRPIVFGPLHVSHLVLMESGTVVNRPHYWRVVCEDRGGNRTMGDPPWMWFHVSGDLSDAREEPSPWTGAAARLQVWPNPTRGRIWFRPPEIAAGQVCYDILDARGGLVAGGTCAAADGQGERRGAVTGVYSWDGCDRAGRRVPSGCYWVRVRAPVGPAGGWRAGVRPVLILR